jgi:hypothetical protein
VLRVEPANTTVEIERCRVADGTVLIAGRVIVNIPFKTGRDPSEMGEREENDRSGRGRGNRGEGRVMGGRRLAEPEVVEGDLRHATAFIPFTLWRDVAGAQEGDMCRILSAGVVDLLFDQVDRDRIDVRVEISIRVQITREQVVDINAQLDSQGRFVTFPSFR